MGYFGYYCTSILSFLPNYSMVNGFVVLLILFERNYYCNQGKKRNESENIQTNLKPLYSVNSVKIKNEINEISSFQVLLFNSELCGKLVDDGRCLPYHLVVEIWVLTPLNLSIAPWIFVFY
ncbi:hypothetical protein F4703DRAFT_1792865 [Phycomyces blakesleeanus]|uniref:Uncharacterized protein n=1 Tax=Phycomyces blakesleeanus (strain ATCC 8743b / DSM 1359 / FGSC 10004 / NBRC 33097 / NRRL 1555) TaxID=763407 RepID=A0A162NF87_PHYB8|nr:hypothetical protein PHYBLDRAFT_67148 [Phycomyces blakesleeanus NRRL 1555(-)]OAD69054.1 hypothetical protein PHYBLDRAFT_67148 [Phycomyces blakesleeanus NRRL 1555(-)]|eukprot:XP_018287094.1 hypothetical protein PHYBLDRAFT_67148 [Phycomyces blakesleeanus NRRL 1555(-)]